MDVAITRLKLGDYIVDRRFVFERKTVRDLVVSIVDGRLFSQCRGLANAALRPVLIIEGDDSDVASTQMKWESIQGALVTITLFFGIPVLRTRTPDETVRTMLIAARQANTVATGALPRHGYRPLAKRARQLFILQGLPGIGPGRARLLLERFGSVESVIGAAAADLQSIKGIGERGAGKIRWAVEDSTRHYG
jgi:ERCC4-type nuclease